jgi:thymidylate synthase (FAD)
MSEYLSPHNFEARLISYSKPSRELVQEGLYDIQELIGFCARVSNPANQMNLQTSEKLIKYLIKHQHWSPLEMVSACVEITTTRDIARQILRHRSFSFQEFSQRYADPTAEMSEAFVTREARFQDTTNRQNSVEFDMTNDEQRRLAFEWERSQKRVLYAVEKEYKWAIANGIAKEQARALLPEGLTKSRMYMNGTLRSWIHYIQLRSANGTQKEHIEIAKACAQVIAEIFPLTTQLVSE